MKTVIINAEKYSVSLELNKYLQENKECKQTLKFLLNLGIMTGSVIKL